MPYKTWGTNDYLYSTEVNNYLMRQTVVKCTSGTRPASPDEGMHAYETDTDRLMKYTGSTWEIVSSSRQSFTPSLTAATTNPTLGASSVRAGYYSYLGGGLIFYSFAVTFGSSGVNAGNGQYLVDLPVASTAALGVIQPAMGSAMMRDSSTANITDGTSYIPASNLGVMAFLISGTSTVSNTVPWTWAAGDYITGSITYPI